jgi:hypothetical protein
MIWRAALSFTFVMASSLCKTGAASPHSSAIAALRVKWHYPVTAGAATCHRVTRAAARLTVGTPWRRRCIDICHAGRPILAAHKEKLPMRVASFAPIEEVAS